MNQLQAQKLGEFAATPGRTEPILVIIDENEITLNSMSDPPTTLTDSFTVCVVTPEGDILQQGKVTIRDKEIDIAELINEYVDWRKKSLENVIRTLLERNS